LATFRLDPLEELIALPQIPKLDFREPIHGRGGKVKEGQKEKLTEGA